jgi:hypothetical protein
VVVPHEPTPMRSGQSVDLLWYMVTLAPSAS